MASARLSVYLAVSIIVVTVVVSGPLVPQVDLTTEREVGTPGYCEAEGNASITVKDVPTGQFRIEQRRFGAGAYYIAAPDARVAVEGVQGCPIIAYRLAIDDLGYLGQRLYFLTEERTGTISLSAVEGTFTPSDVGSGPYDGNLSIRVRGDRTRTVYETTVTIRVEE